ncbi:DUF6630 family protein [Tenacibaculum maritimum]|uniref:DUF6630 family protein n=2 Tax=Tenacibaculum maritimum TaxID=107401 RepID=UPI001E2E761D|nr:hypothetical protein [Tenacibaculum maritimum]MCD9566570.1 hypothetical protein [Tenacibaculum maritimum]MCD9579619.1 hypothetical protein [Tenacibaculum maritimum]MCD9585184.1 hypothetical protein [Tenacibaculum maritimum]MCD9596997.1 hypothetical protein [Tenacibaculum maritimum]MCD9614117.1 hypothetical protein [Tenacibaculum maritimum]
MARIYYHKKELAGLPIKDDDLHLSLFNYLLNNATASKFKLQDSYITSFWGFKRKKIPCFKEVLILKDDIFYNSPEGSFYLPNGIIFYDKNDFNFPSEFYFISQINNQIELRKCNGGQHVKWFQIPELHKAVKAPNIFQKIKNTLIALKGNIDAAPSKKIKKELPPVSKLQEEALRKLVKYCIPNPKASTKTINFINALKKDRENYYSLLYFVITSLEDHLLNFIVRIDWKLEAEYVREEIQNILNKHYPNRNIQLPSYEKSIIISVEGVFKDLDDLLRKKGLQLSFIDTQSDEYIFIIHKTADEKKVKNTVHNIGYPCHSRPQLTASPNS